MKLPKQNTIIFFNSVTLRIIGAMDKACLDEAAQECRPTSGIDGTHILESKHNYAQAMDFELPSQDHESNIRIRDAAWKDLNETNARYEQRFSIVNKKYDVLLEGDHFHIEFDPVMRGL